MEESHLITNGPVRSFYNELVEKNIFAAASNVNLNKIIGYKKDGEKHTFLEDYKGRRMPDEEAKRDLK